MCDRDRKPLPNIIDVEASGFGVRSYPIEVGLVTSSGERFCTLIKPVPEWTHWDEKAERVHGISRDNLDTAGQPPLQVAHTLNEMLGGTTIYSDAWVVDDPWLRRLFAVVGVRMDFRISTIEMILREEELLAWDQTKKDVTAALSLKRHRASADAQIIQHTWAACRYGLQAKAPGHPQASA